jgi:hypothetical protein
VTIIPCLGFSVDTLKNVEQSIDSYARIDQVLDTNAEKQRSKAALDVSLTLVLKKMNYN